MPIGDNLVGFPLLTQSRLFLYWERKMVCEADVATRVRRWRLFEFDSVRVRYCRIFFALPRLLAIIKFS